MPAKSLFPTVFAYPQLFTIRADMGELFDLRFLRDRDGDEYELVSSPDGSVVIPIKPFSLVDRIPFLKKDGATKFILDFSFIDLKKQVYKRVMSAAHDGVVLPESGRFNWKDGFWNPEEERSPARSADSGERPALASRGPVAEGENAAPGPAPRVSGRTGGTGRPDRPGRGGHPWKVALAAKARDAGRQSDRTSANVPGRKPAKAGRPGKPGPSRPPRQGRDH